MQDRSRRYRLRELIYQKLKQGPISVSDLVLWLDQHLDADDELSRALIPEVWRVEPKSETGQGHGQERKWFLRVQILRELAVGGRQRVGLEPVGRLKVDYLGLTADRPELAPWATKLGCDPKALAEGVASLLDAARSRRMVYDSITNVYSKVWMDGELQVMRGYLPSMKGVPAAMKFQRDGQDDEGRIKQWYSNYGTVAKQAAVAWGVNPDEVKPFLEDMWQLVTEKLNLLAPVQLKGARGGLLPGCVGAHQVDANRLTLRPDKGMYRCQTCRRLHTRINPGMSCMAWRCAGKLAAAGPGVRHAAGEGTFSADPGCGARAHRERLQERQRAHQHAGVHTHAGDGREHRRAGCRADAQRAAAARQLLAACRAGGAAVSHGLGHHLCPSGKP
jgi:hypothetical protein